LIWIIAVKEKFFLSGLLDIKPSPDWKGPG